MNISKLATQDAKEYINQPTGLVDGSRLRINEDIADLITTIIMNAQIQLRALRHVADAAPKSATPESYEAAATLAVSVAERVHQMLDSCLRPLGMVPIGCYVNDLEDVAKERGVELPPALRGKR